MPDTVEFQVWNARLDPAKHVDGTGKFEKKHGRTRWSNTLNLASQRAGFFGASKDDQLSALRDFVEESYRLARGME